MLVVYAIAFVAAALSMTVTMALVVPLTGAVVRFRANYNPKGLQLDPEEGVQLHTGPAVSSVFGTLRRVKKIEGWSGLYRGLMPILLITTLILLAVMIVIGADVSDLGSGAYKPPSIGSLAMFVYSTLGMLISLPFMIITNRSITTPHKLPYFRPIYSLRVLFTPTERRRPWLLYLTPGLLASQVMQIAYVFLISRFLSTFLSSWLNINGELRGETLVRLGICFAAVMILRTAVLTPLQVISTRLTIQRNHAAPEFNSVAQEEDGDAMDYIEYSGADEDVITLRTDGHPYTGMVDCAKSIIHEEGWKVLYRAWWFTMLGGLTVS